MSSGAAGAAALSVAKPQLPLPARRRMCHVNGGLAVVAYTSSTAQAPAVLPRVMRVVMTAMRCGASTATPVGQLMHAASAGEPSAGSACQSSRTQFVAAPPAMETTAPVRASTRQSWLPAAARPPGAGWYASSRGTSTTYTAPSAASRARRSGAANALALAPRSVRRRPSLALSSRTAPWPASAMSVLPLGRLSKSLGQLRHACKAGPPSPTAAALHGGDRQHAEKPPPMSKRAPPPPTSVDMTPLASTRRTRLLPASAMRRSPSDVKAVAIG